MISTNSTESLGQCTSAGTPGDPVCYCAAKGIGPETHKPVCGAHLRMEQRHVSGHFSREDFDNALDTFLWSSDGTTNGEPLGEVYIDPDDPDVLVLETFTRDTDNPSVFGPLRSTMRIDWLRSPRNQIRDIIHHHLLHEADERLWFGEQRPYYPEH